MLSSLWEPTNLASSFSLWVASTSASEIQKVFCSVDSYMSVEWFCNCNQIKTRDCQTQGYPNCVTVPSLLVGSARSSWYAPATTRKAEPTMKQIVDSLRTRAGKGLDICVAVIIARVTHIHISVVQSDVQ